MLSFIIATILVTILPGPSMIVIMVNAIQKGLMAGCQSAVGAVVADAILMIIVMSGIGSFIYASPAAFGLLKWSGALYLGYLGAKELFGRDKNPSDTPQEEPKISRPGKSAFLEGVGVTLLNPKIIGFFIAFFPQFLDNTRPILGQLLILGPVFLLTVLILFLLTAVFARIMSGFIESERGSIFMKRFAGISLLGSAALSATMK
jgi:threonine/homoserine/homoserine lactone efflux protein